MYIVYEVSKSFNISDYPTLKNCLFGAVTLTKNADIDKNKYSGNGTGFDRHGSFLFNNGICRKVVIFRVNMSLSIHVDNKGKCI